MIRSFIASLLVVFGLCSPVDAWTHGGANQAVGKAQIGPTLQDLSAQSFINILNAQQMGFIGGATPAALDADQFPVRNFTGTIATGIAPWAPTLSTTGPWVWGWDAGRSCFDIFILKNATLVSKSDPSITVTNGSGVGNFEVQGNCGQAGSVTFNWTDTTGINLRFSGGYSQWSSNTTGRMWMIRQSDQTAFNNGVYWTPEQVAFYKALKPESIRPMSSNILLIQGLTASNAVNWNYRLKTTAFSFASLYDFPPGTRCGGTTSFCTLSLTGGAITAAAAADTPLGGWVDGEQLTGNMPSNIPTLGASAIANNGGKCQFTTSSTSLLTNGAPVAIIGSGNSCNTLATTIASIDNATQFTTNTTFGSTCSGSIGDCGNIAFQTLSITGKSGGAKLILHIGAYALSFPNADCGLGFNQGGTSDAVSFTYNSVLDKVLACGNGAGISNHVPIEVQAQLANLVNADFWYNFPTWANDNYVTNSANLFYSTLNSNLKFIAEYSNEVWNGGQQANHWTSQMSVALGIAGGPVGGSSPFQALRVRQINGNLLPASSWSAAMSRLDRTFCMQAATDTFTINSMLAGTAGNGLVSPGSSAYQAYVGGSAVNYNTSPNRPGDFTDTLCYAPYTGGGSAFSGQSPDVGIAPTSFDAPLLNNAVSLWNASNTAGAIALVDGSVRGDILNRVQTVTASGTTFTTPLAHNFSQYDVVRFTVAGGTSYSGLTLTSPYQILTTPSSTTFTAARVLNGSPQSTVNAGSVGTGTTSVGYLGNSQFTNSFTSIWPQLSAQYTKYQNMAVNAISPAPAGGSYKVRWYEGALEPMPPTAQQLINIGVTDTSATVTSVVGNTICFSSMPFNSAGLGSTVAFTNVGSLTGVSTGNNYTPTSVSGNCMGLVNVVLGGSPGGATVVGNQSLANTVTAWKNDASAAATVNYYMQAFTGVASGVITTGAMPNSTFPAWFTLNGVSAWGLNANDTIAAPSLFKTYNGFATFSN